LRKVLIAEKARKALPERYYQGLLSKMDILVFADKTVAHFQTKLNASIENFFERITKCEILSRKTISNLLAVL
jgi:hypothetical protein